MTICVSDTLVVAKLVRSSIVYPVLSLFQFILFSLWAVSFKLDTVQRYASLCDDDVISSYFILCFFIKLPRISTHTYLNIGKRTATPQTW